MYKKLIIIIFAAQIAFVDHVWSNYMHVFNYFRSEKLLLTPISKLTPHLSLILIFQPLFALSWLAKYKKPSLCLPGFPHNYRKLLSGIYFMNIERESRNEKAVTCEMGQLCMSCVLMDVYYIQHSDYKRFQSM